MTFAVTEKGNKRTILRSESMDIHMLEYAAEILFRMCRERPEICPHDYSWSYSKKSTEEGKLETHYTCRLCGRKDVRIEDER